MAGLGTPILASKQQIGAQVDKFGTFGLILALAPSAEGKVTGLLAPSVLGAGSSLWTGDAGFSYPIELPPGPAGFAPLLSLDYSGGGVNDMMRQVGPVNHDIQAGFAGLGWSLGGLGAITQVDNTYYLSFAGGSYELYQKDNIWHTKPESFLRIEHVQNSYIKTWEAVYAGCGWPGSPTPFLGQATIRYTNTDPWTVWTPDGRRFTFGSTLDSKGSPTQPGATPYRWGGWLSCGSTCNRNQGDNTCDGSVDATPYQWNLVRVEDPNQNQINVSYAFTSRGIGGSTAACSSIWEVINGKSYVHESYATALAYNGVTVTFTAGSRNDQPAIGETNCANQKVYLDHRLENMTVAAGGQLVRRYDLAYETQTHLRLTSIGLKGRDLQALPVATTFGYRQLGAGANTQFLETVNNGYGGVAKLSYLTESANLPDNHQCSSGERFVVNERRMIGGVDPAAITTYEYGTGVSVGTCRAGGKYEFLGFDQVTETVRTDGDSQIKQQVVSMFHQKDSAGSADVRKGKKWRETIGDGVTTLQDTSWEWVADGDWAKLASNTTSVNGVGRQIRYFYDLDYQGGAQYGNATRIAEYANATDATPYRTTLNRYYPNTTAWIVNKPAFTNVYAGAVPDPPAAPDVSQLAASTWYIYSDDQANPAPSWNQPVGSKGQLRGVRRYQGQDTGGNHQYVDVRYRHDAFGNVTEEQAYRSYGAANAWANTVANTVATSYDTTFAAYPLSVTVTPGTGAGATLTTSNRYYGINAEAGGSGSVGQLQSVTDPNGAVTRYQYDVFGRPQAEARPGDTLDIPTLNYAYYDAEQPFRIVTAVRETSGCGGCNHPSVTFYDGLGQVIQTKTEAQDGSEMIVTDTRYNALGLVQDQYVPYKLNNATTFWNYVGLNTAQPKTNTVYDALGRVRVVTAPDGSRNETWYTMEHDTTQPVDPDFAEPRLSVYSIDANSHFVRRTHDAFGNLRSVSEFTGIWGQPDWGTESRTRYAYDVTGRLTDVWDAARPTPNHTQIGYDRLGRKEQMSDPDMGTWSYAYDTAGNLTRQTDARKQTICFFYDELNRLTGKSYQTTTACPTSQPASPVVSYTYDFRSVLGKEQNMGVGRRTGMTDQTGSTGWVYDARGRVTREKKTVDGTTYSTRYTYRADDQVETTIYPDGEVVTTGYDNRRLPVSLSSALGTYVSSSSYDAEGRLDLRVFQSDGLQTDYVYYAWNAGQGFGGRLNQILSGVGNGSTGLQNLAYAYDKAGNITRIRDDNNSGQRQCFVYDPLNRLTGAFIGDTNCAPTTAGQGAYSESYEYNAIGNLTKRNGVTWEYDAQVTDCAIGT